MLITRFDSGLLSSNMYVISENGHAIVIDPCLDVRAAALYDVDWLLTTHEHYDHIFGVNAWKKRSGAPLLCSRACAERIRDPRKNLARNFDAFCVLQSFASAWNAAAIDPAYVCEAERMFEGSMLLEWQGHTVRLIEMPGHSPGSIGIWLDNDVLFSGDSLIQGREIELQLPGGSRKAWEERGKPVIAALAAGTTVCPGHFSEFIWEKT